MYFGFLHFFIEGGAGVRPPKCAPGHSLLSQNGTVVPRASKVYCLNRATLSFWGSGDDNG